jgi:hypothetical protein
MQLWTFKLDDDAEIEDVMDKISMDIGGYDIEVEEIEDAPPAPQGERKPKKQD